MNNTTFNAFDKGSLRLPSSTVKFADILWAKHPEFNGVELKHIVTAGSGICISDGSALSCDTGVISILPAGVPHEVTAGSDGLFLFAKFIPALC